MEGTHDRSQAGLISPYIFIQGHESALVFLRPDQTNAKSRNGTEAQRGLAFGKTGIDSCL